MTRSLTSRLLLIATLALLLFLCLVGFALDRAFQSRTEVSYRNQLQSQVYGLLAAMEVDQQGTMRVASNLPEPRYERPDSGLYAEVTDAAGKVLWRSGSNLGRRLPADVLPAVGAIRFQRLPWDGSGEVFLFQHGVAWELDDGARPFVVRVAQSLDFYRDEVGSFRRTLLLWLGGLGLLLLALQAILLRWTLSPLRQVVSEVSAVERGEKTTLSQDYPQEISILTSHLNEFMSSAQRQKERYRNALGDLAHSLKTPLAVVGALAENKDRDTSSSEEIRQCVAEMREIVDYQLQRAVSYSGASLLTSPIDVSGQVDKVIRSLGKVYRDKNVECRSNIEDGTLFYGEAGDLYEVMGNLLDNAYKWCTRRVVVSARPLHDSNTRRPGLEISVEDDGPGIEEARRRGVLQRGVRGDTRKDGQGIGLTMTGEIVAGYGGDLEIGASRWGGAKVTLSLPGLQA